MRKSCPYCGRIHDVMYKCPQSKRKKYKKKESEYDAYRNTAAWQHRRDEIKKRDMYMCQICLRGLYDYGARRHNTRGISVHHIISLKNNFELRDVNANLISLCDCHHKMADRGEISAEELKTIALEQEGIPPGMKVFNFGKIPQETRGKSTQKIP